MVTPCVGVWIETVGDTPKEPTGNKVTPCVGVWIETLNGIFINEFEKSHPAWVCGLKPYAAA